MEQEYIIDNCGKRRKASRIGCDQCGIEFLKESRFIGKNNYCSKKCSIDSKRADRINITCAWCGENFKRNPSRLVNSRSGIYFCSRRCKDSGQKKKNGIKEIWPEHYHIEPVDYRKLAFDAYENVCCGCGYDKYKSILEVHHIDENRNNNSLDNLIILCSNCHQSIHRGCATMEGREIIWG